VGFFVRSIPAALSGPLGISILNHADGQWSSLPGFTQLPPQMVTALAVDGYSLWVEGAGYIARIDLHKNELRKYCRIPADSVNRIELGGGYLWSQFARGLYRTSLSH
jgi:hypothetical protein